METQLTSQCYEIPICGKDILWKHDYPLMLINQKIMKFLFYGKRQIFSNVGESEAIMEFQFVEREIMKCQLPTYIGKNKLMCRDDVIKLRVQELRNRAPSDHERPVTEILNQNSACTREIICRPLSMLFHCNLFIIMLCYNTRNV